MMLYKIALAHDAGVDRIAREAAQRVA